MQTSIIPKSVDQFPGVINANRLVVLDGFYKNETGVNFSYRLERVDIVDETEVITIARASGVYLTPEQWASWPAGSSPSDDEAFILGCVADNIGVTIA